MVVLKFLLFELSSLLSKSKAYAMGKVLHKVLQIARKQLKNSQKHTWLGWFLGCDGPNWRGVRQGFSALAMSGFLA